MSRKKRFVKKVFTVVGFDDHGTEIERIKNLSEAEAVEKAGEFSLSRVMEITVIAPRTLCEVDEERVAITTVRVSGDLIKVCKYHAAGVYATFKGIPVKDKVKWEGRAIAPDWLCVKYCPSYWEGRCRAFQEPETEKEDKKRFKGYQGMTVLCVEDSWWKIASEAV